MPEILLVMPPGGTFSGLPLGLAYVAAYLEKFGYKVECLDAVAEGLTTRDVLKKITRSKPRFLGLSVLTPAAPNAYRIARQAKELGVTTIMGGIHPTALPAEALENGADFVVIGEGEVTVAELIEAIDCNRNVDTVRGIAYTRNGSIGTTDPRPPIDELDKLPFPAREMFPLRKYPRIERASPGGEIMSSRGCPYSCLFCSSRLVHGRKFRARSPQNVVDEIDEIVQKFRIRRIGFLDDTFTINKERVVRICDLIRERGLDIEWYCETRVDLVDRELLQKMKNCGCFLIEYGVESGSERVLRRIKKGITLDQTRRAFAMTKEVGIRTRADFMIGNPTETKEDAKETLKLAIELDPWRASFSIVTPLPGSELYEYALRNNMLEIMDYGKYDMMVRSVWHSDVMSSRDMADLQKQMYRKFYLRLKVLARQIADIRSGYDVHAVYNLIKSWLHVMREQ